MLGETTVFSDEHYVNLEADRVKALPACERLVALLEDLLRYVGSFTVKSRLRR